MILTVFSRFQNLPKVQLSPCRSAALNIQVRQMNMKCGDDDRAASVSVCLSLTVTVFQVRSSSLPLMSLTGSVCIKG